MRNCSALAAGLAMSVPATAYVGDMTYYTPSEGSCGVYSLATADVVALSYGMMANGANPNQNPKCFSKISIYNPRTGQTNWATIGKFFTEFYWIK